MAPEIPDRWLEYRPIGERVEGTRFIAFKVPLREQINKAVDENNRLYGKLLLEKVPNLGVIIDLTNTNRYYDPNLFKNEGVEHNKIMIPGHVTPPTNLVNRFKDIVKQFIQRNSDNDKLIGVHCTHGVNRTGYLICNYMVSEMSVDPTDAIKKFAAARGHKIERSNYLDSLRTLNSGEAGRQRTASHTYNAKDEHLSSKKDDNRTNWRTERTDKVEHNWRIPRDQSSEINAYGSRPSYRDRDDRANTSSSRDAERYSKRRDNSVRSSDRERKHKYVNNYRDDTPSKRIRTSSSAEYNSRNIYSHHKQDSQFRDSNRSQRTSSQHYNDKPSYSTYSRSSHTNSNAPDNSTDNKTKLRLRTDYYNEPRTSAQRGRISHYSKRQQQ